MVENLLEYLERAGASDGRLTHVETIPARQEQVAPWPAWVHPQVVEAFGAVGAPHLWSHQEQALNALHEGQHVVLATGTGSGKSLPAWVPILSDLTHADGDTSLAGVRERPSALYLAPTKALAADQLDALNQLTSHLEAQVLLAPADGDTTSEVKRWARAQADIVLSNPDYLHHVLLADSDSWRRFLRSLRYIVVDELHYWRGLAGANVAWVLRRLLRVARSLGGDPQVVMLSATAADPLTSATAMTASTDVVAITEDGSPAAERHLLFWRPALHPRGQMHLVEATEDAPAYPLPALRVSPWSEASNLAAGLVDRGAKLLTFVLSRYGAEAVAAQTRDRLVHRGSFKSDAVSAYRGGFLPEERRELERALREGDLVAVATTNALELGIDISGLDVTLTCEWPGSRASLLQQAGRAGRAGRPGISVFIAGENPLDNYLVQHPEAALGPVEDIVLDLFNPHVMSAHLLSAAAESPLTVEDLQDFGVPDLSVVEDLTRRGFLRRRDTGWHWNHGLTYRPHSLVDIRGGGGDVQVVDVATGAVIGTVPDDRADAEVHPDAIYLHQGKTYHVLELTAVSQGDPTGAHSEGEHGEGSGQPAPSRQRLAVAQQVTTPLRTRSGSHSQVRIVSEDESWTSPDGLVTWFTGEVEVSSRVTDYDLLRTPNMEFISNHELNMPERVLRTTATWYVLNPGATAAAHIDTADLPGALHAAEHSAIGMLPLLTTSDRWDLGGLSIVEHTQTGKPTVFVHDARPGGAGYSAHGYRVATQWMDRTYQTVSECACSVGCPACIQSPKCGNRNDPLSKSGAIALLKFLKDRSPEGIQ